MSEQNEYYAAVTSAQARRRLPTSIAWAVGVARTAALFGDAVDAPTLKPDEIAEIRDLIRENPGMPIAGVLAMYEGGAE